MSEQTLTSVADLVSEAPPAHPTLKQKLRSDGISRAEHSALVEERKAIAAKGGRPPAVQPTRDLLIERGYKAAGHLFPKVLARLEEAIDDKSDALHERAMDIMAKRVIPIAFFESLAKSEFRTEDEGGRLPNITINISTAAAPAVTVDAVTVDAVDVPFKELP